MLISASLMCANQLNLHEDISALENAECNMLHIDVMDGKFVPNYAINIDTIHSLVKSNSLPLDIHLMTERPSEDISKLNLRSFDRIAFHYEATKFHFRTIKAIKDKNCLAGIALNPSTPISMIADFADLLDYVLIMTVEPGFAGQAFIKQTLIKIEQAKSLAELHKKSQFVFVDGNINEITAKKCLELGADGLVCGTSSIFKNDQGLELSTKRFIKLLLE